MEEIYFINDFYVRTTSWHKAFKSWLSYYGELTAIMEKSLNATETLDEILKLVGALSKHTIRHIGIAKEFTSFVDYEHVREEDET